MARRARSAAEELARRRTTRHFRKRAIMFIVIGYPAEAVAVRRRTRKPLHELAIFR